MLGQPHTDSDKLNSPSDYIPLYYGIIAFCVTIILAAVARTYRPPMLDGFAHFMSDQGNTYFLWGGYILLIVAAAIKSKWRDIVLALTVLAVITLIVQGFKHTIGFVPRPGGGTEGFPSGHAASAIALGYLLSCRFRKFSVIAYGIAVAIAWSRVDAGAHYFYQVACGSAMGLLTSFVIERKFNCTRSAHRIQGSVGSD
jgi:membrane-associated phospholipid phosphatase